MKLSEVAIFTDAVERTVAFYQRLFGSAPAHQEDGFALFEMDGFHLVVHRTYAADKDAPPGESHVGFSVEDLDASIDSLQSAGYEVEFPPRDYPWGRSAYLRDPSGNLVQLSE
jgi:catechol 2,3-dioxygenase-like lactoylglutathione lyase family enzyme